VKPDPDISVIIPSYKGPYLVKTIQSVLDNFETDFEVVPVIDGYDLKVTLPDDPRVRPVFHEKNMGMREAINTGVARSSGRNLMRSDEHCLFGKGFDRIILDTIEPNWIVVGRRFFLDPEKWEVMDDKPPIDFEKLIILDKPHKGVRKFSAVSWKDRNRRMRRFQIAETMAMQGSVWVMPRWWWNRVIGRLQTEGYGPLYQDTTEMLFKTWRAGGRLVLNKNTFYAHKHRDFNRSHQYPVEKAIPEWAYALSMWEQEYQEVIRKRWSI